MPTTGPNARLSLTAGITALGIAATVGLAFMVTAKIVLQKVRSTSDSNESYLSSTMQIYPKIFSI